MRQENLAEESAVGRQLHAHRRDVLQLSEWGHLSRPMLQKHRDVSSITALNVELELEENSEIADDGSNLMNVAEQSGFVLFKTPS